MAIPASRDEGEAVALLVLAALLSAVVSPVAVLLVALLIGQNAGVIDGWLFVSVAVAFTLITALIDVFTYWRSHRQRFGVSAQNTVARAGITAGTQIVLGPVSTIGLVGGAMAGALRRWPCRSVTWWIDPRSSFGLRGNNYLGWPGTIVVIRLACHKD